MHTYTRSSQMCTHVIVQAFSPHLSVVNREVAHVYSVQCTQCIHRNAVYVMLQIQTMSMQVGTTLTYCVMYCTYRQCLTLLLAH